MTQTQEYNVPKLRFRDAQGKAFPEWVGKRLGNFYEFKSTNSLSRDKLNYEGGEVRNIHYGDIHTKFKPAFNLRLEQVPFVNSNVDLSLISEDKYCQHGDLVVADASEDYDDIGKTIELINLDDEKVLAGLHTLLARLSSKDIYIGFGTFVMACAFVRKQIKIIAQGTKVLGISAGRMAKIKLPIPCPEEQQKIAAFLSSVDRKIDQLTQKKALLEQYKKGVMQKLFSQELRFKDAQGNAFPDWVEKRLGEVATFKKGKGISKADIVEDGKNKCIRYGELFTAYGEIIKSILSRTNSEKSNSVLSKKNDILMPTSDVTPNGLATASALDETNIILGGDILIIRTKKVLNSFFCYFVASHKNKIMRLVSGVTVYHIYGSDMATVHVNIPSLPEQQKIAAFLSAIDRKIDLVATELTHAQTFKKGLLQQMFI